MSNPTPDEVLRLLKSAEQEAWKLIDKASSVPTAEIVEFHFMNYCSEQARTFMTAKQ